MTSTTFRIDGDLDVRRLGFGAMHGAMHLPTEPGPDRENALAVARRAVELGVTLIDTAHLYGGGANEELLAEALHPYPSSCTASTPTRRSPTSSARCGSSRPRAWSAGSGCRRSPSPSWTGPGRSSTS